MCRIGRNRGTDGGTSGGVDYPKLPIYTSSHFFEFRKIKEKIFSKSNC